MGSWKMHAGINHAPAYQVSGIPFCSGGINARATAVAKEVAFPYVTRWVTIINNDVSNACKVGFSRNGLEDENYFTIGKGVTNIPVESGRLELKVSSIYLTGSSNVDVVAGLTTIRSDATSMGTGLPNWSGSAGVG